MHSYLNSPRTTSYIWIRCFDIIKFRNSKTINFTKNFSSRSCISTREQLTGRAVYILSGQLPLVADLHKRVLGTLGSVLRSSSIIIERELAERQILLKDKKSKSWFVYVSPFLSYLVTLWIQSCWIPLKLSDQDPHCFQLELILKLECCRLTLFILTMYYPIHVHIYALCMKMSSLYLYILSGIVSKKNL